MGIWHTRGSISRQFFIDGMDRGTRTKGNDLFQVSKLQILFGFKTSLLGVHRIKISDIFSMMGQVVYLHFFTYNQHRFWAFTQMQRAHARLQDCKGLQFYKLLGTGAGAGFSLRPDFSTYALLSVWDNEDDKKNRPL